MNSRSKNRKLNRRSQLFYLLVVINALAAAASLYLSYRLLSVYSSSSDGGTVWWQNVNQFGLVIACIALLIVSAVAWHIHKLSAQMRANDNDVIASERRINAIVNTAVDPIITISGVGLIKSFNPAAERLFGYTESEVLEQNVKLLMPAPYRDEHDGYLARFLQTGEQRVIGVGREVVGQHKNGRMIPIHLSVSQALDKNENNDEDILFTGIIRDLTEQNQRQKELLLANRRAEKFSAFGQILNRSLNEIYIFDAETLQFVHVNRGARDNIGYTMKELRQMTPLDIKPEHTAESFAERVAPLIELKQDNIEFESTHQRKDGSTYPVQVYLETSFLNDRPVFVAVILDITERQKIEQTLRDSTERAQESDRAKSSFLANMSHEIRTPMTAILGYAESLLDADQSEPERLNCIHTIRRNGEYLLELINDILDLSKIESGKMTTEQVAMQPCRVVAEVISLMGVRADAKELAFEVEYDGAIPDTIQSDPIRLRQILINLIGNAIKFTESGTIRLIVSLVDGENPQLQFDVVDSGCGMTEKQIGKLFKPFMQADASTTRQFGGTGLGLTISKRFAGLLGGDICVAASKPGVGSTFRVTVATGSLDGVKMLEDPRAATSVAGSKATAKIHHVSLAGLRILLAEDGPDNQRLISFVLKKAGATVAIASNGQIAFEATKAAHDEGMPFDAVLMDMQMPVLDGYQATKKLREFGFEDMPIIALTANAMAGDREKCIDAGCDDYATKPIDRKQLVDTIMTAVIEKRASGVTTQRPKKIAQEST